MNVPAEALPTEPLPTGGLRAVSVDMQLDSLVVGWSSGEVDTFHYVWLRDNCGCAVCRHAIAGERLSDPASIPLDLVAVSASTLTASGAGNVVRVLWPDGHETTLTAEWLFEHAYGESARNRRKPPHTFWRAADVRKELPEASFDEVMHSDAALLALLRQLRSLGFSIVRGLPTDRRSSIELAQRIGNLRDSNFGLHWEVESMPKPDSLAYTSVKLTAHTDLVSREAQPGLQFLHCLVNDATGGASILVDGFAVAEQLRTEAPDHFATLTRVGASFRYQNDNTDVSATSPVIRLDHRGQYFEVRYSNALLAPLQCEPEDVLPFYEAYQQFSRLLRDPSFEFSFRLEPGDCEVFDNRRVMHGREEFNPNSGPRHLQGCYVDTDDFLSRLRVLERTQDFRVR